MLTVSENYHGVHRSFTPTVEKPMFEEAHETPLTRAANEILAHGGLVNMDEEYQREFVARFGGGLHSKKGKSIVVEINDDLKSIFTSSEKVYELFQKSLNGINPYVLYSPLGLSRSVFVKLHFTKIYYRIENVRTGEKIESDSLPKICDLAKQKLNLSLRPASVSHCLNKTQGYMHHRGDLIAIATRIRKIRRVILKKS